MDENTLRNITISYATAKEWYESDNETLRTIALKAFTEGELNGFSMNDIIAKVDLYVTNVPLVRSEVKKALALIDLQIIAKYFNRDWKKNSSNLGYMFMRSFITGNLNVISTKTIYPGVVYFKNEGDAYKAMDILGDRIKYLYE